MIKEKAIQTKRKRARSDEEIIIDCTNEESVNAVDKILGKKLPKTCSVTKETIKNPIVKVTGIENYTNTTEQDIFNYMKERNFRNYEDKCKGLNIYTNEKTKTVSIFLEVTSALYKYIADNKYVIFVGYQSCRVYDSINVNPCYKCGTYKHSYTSLQEMCQW